MATITRLQITTADADALQVPAGAHKRGLVAALTNLLAAIGLGARTGTNITREESAVQASGTVTCATVIATNSVTINGVAIAAVTGAAGNNQFDRSGTDAATATNLAAAINTSTSALINKHVTASANNAVVTITAKAAGHSGNAVTLATSGATLAIGGNATGGRLGGGSGTITSVDF